MDDTGPEAALTEWRVDSIWVLLNKSVYVPYKVLELFPCKRFKSSGDLHVQVKGTNVASLITRFLAEFMMQALDDM